MFDASHSRLTGNSFQHQKHLTAFPLKMLVEVINTVSSHLFPWYPLTYSNLHVIETTILFMLHITNLNTIVNFEPVYFVILLLSQQHRQQQSNNSLQWNIH